MKLILYKNLSPDNTIGKTLEEVKTLSINLRNNIDLLNPVISITRQEAIKAVNYAYIEGLNRFYFIDVIESVNNGVFSLRLRVDVLETYKEDILKSHAKYEAPISSGDFGNITLDTIAVEVVEVSTEIELPEIDNAILSTIGG